MALKEDIDGQYEKLVALAEELDSCLQATGTAEGSWLTRGFSIKDAEKYWRLRKELELGIADWMHLLRKGIENIPEATRKSTKERRTDEATQDTYFVTVYDNKNFEAVMDFFDAIKRQIEDGHGTLESIAAPRPIFSQIRDLRGRVLSFSASLGLFIPEDMVTIEQQVDVIFKLRDKGLEEIATELEGIVPEEDSIKKCLKARIALEKLIENYCGRKEDKPSRFFTNLDLAIKKGVIDKTKRMAIAGTYSFTSKIVHKDIEANARNTNFAITGMFNIISSLVS